MGNTLLVVTDLGTFKAFNLTFTELHNTPRLDLVDSFSPPEMDERYANTLTTRAGRSAQGNMNLQSAGNHSDGESHNMELEKRRRVIRSIGEHIHQLLSNGNYDRCFLAAPSEINPQLLEEIEPVSREKIENNVPRNLTGLKTTELLEHFV